jgi:hypothetical protein
MTPPPPPPPPTDRRAPPPLTPHQRALLRAETMCATETIDAWWSGKRRVREATAIRLDRGARKLGLLPSEAPRP